MLIYEYQKLYLSLYLFLDIVPFLKNFVIKVQIFENWIQNRNANTPLTKRGENVITTVQFIIYHAAVTEITYLNQ